MYGNNEGQKRAGGTVMRTGFVLFVIFGAFFEMIFSINNSQGVRGLVFPALMILLGGYLILRRLNLLSGDKSENIDPSTPTEPPSSNQ
jgi:hypothetical protein